MPTRKKRTTVNTYFSAKLWIVLVGLLLLIGAVVIALGFYLISPLDSTDTEGYPITISRGIGVNEIGKQLEQQGILRSWISLRLYTQFLQPGSVIQAGNFVLSPSMTLFEIAQFLQKGTEDVWVTVIEGMRVEEVAEAFEAQLPGFQTSVFVAEAAKHEGRLFPDTYLVPQSITEQEVVALLLKTFDEKVEQPLKEKQVATGRSWREILTLASLVEREARTTEARKMVAGILDNRLNQGWPLQIDATLQYIKGYDSSTRNWWPTPFAADKGIDSPYNTYKYAGLPPGPIASPSLNSILAVLSPTPSGYMFYITDPQGGMHYATTYEEHNRNVQLYLR